MSFLGNKYSVPPDYSNRYVICVSLDNFVQIYCDGHSIDTHPLCVGTNQMIISKTHYDPLLTNAKLVNHNSLIDDTYYDSFVGKINMKKYDL